MLYSLRDKRLIEQVSRGVYRLADLPPIGNPDLVTLALQFPNAVICLTSALAYHDLTTHHPHEAVGVRCRRPKLTDVNWPKFFEVGRLKYDMQFLRNHA